MRARVFHTIFIVLLTFGLWGLGGCTRFLSTGSPSKTSDTGGSGGGNAASGGGNSTDYGGTNDAKLALQIAQSDLQTAIAQLRAGYDSDSLCQPVCLNGMDPAVCSVLTGNNSDRLADAKFLILQTLNDASEVINRPAASLFTVSSDALVVNGIQVSALTPFGPSGFISFYRPDTIQASAGLLKQRFGHEIFHKVPSPFSLGSFLKDYEPLPPHFPESDGSSRLATLAGGCLSAYSDRHKTISDLLFPPARPDGTPNNCAPATCHDETVDLASGVTPDGSHKAACADPTDFIASCFAGYYPSGGKFCRPNITADPLTGNMSCTGDLCAGGTGFYRFSIHCCHVARCGSQ